MVSRAEWLAWENKFGQLKSLMSYLPEEYKALYKARYLLAIRLHGVEYAIKNVPNKYKNNQGLLHQRLQLKIKKHFGIVIHGLQNVGMKYILVKEVHFLVMHIVKKKTMEKKF